MKQTTPPVIDMPGAAFDVETEIVVLEEAMRILKSNELPKHEWATWDSFAGRQVWNSETDENWTRRVIQKAIATIVMRRRATPRPARQLVQDKPEGA